MTYKIYLVDMVIPVPCQVLMVVVGAEGLYWRPQVVDIQECILRNSPFMTATVSHLHRQVDLMVYIRTIL